MDTVFSIKNYKAEISTNLKINTTHEHLLTEIRFTISKKMMILFDLKMAHEGPTIYIEISRRERRGEKTTLNNDLIGNNYVMQ